MTNVLDELDIEDVLNREALDYRESHGGSGMQFNVQECPACHDDRWKVYLNTETGLGNCFKCGASYNKFNFIKAILETEHAASVFQYAEELTGIVGFKPERERQHISLEAKNRAALPTSMPLPTTDGRNAKYLEERGVSAELAEQFGLRYCFNGTNIAHVGGDKITQDFSQRIIIPVLDLDGELQTFQGRDVTGTADKKYLFPVGLPGTGRYLLNGHKALATRARELIINEGAFDVIATKAAIDQYDDMSGIVPVGTFGKQLSFRGDQQTQLDGFRRLRNEANLERVTIMWDGEVEALKSALVAAKQLTSIGIKSRIALLPKGCDPNEIDAATLRQAWLDATPYSSTLETRWKLRSPYS